MKKLVMMLALVVAVISAKAACVDWAVGGTSDQVGTTVYLLTSIDDYDDVAALSAAAVSSADIAAAARGKYSTPSKTANDASITSSASFYYAIVATDGKSFSYVEATGMASKVYDPSLQESSKGAFNTINSATILAGTSKSFGGGDVPEPTSGLLLLLGGAMLALRRKQK